MFRQILKYTSMCLIPAMLAFQSPAFAGDWNSVMSLTPGTYVHVATLADKRDVYGVLATVNESSVTVDAKGQQEVIKMGDIRSVYQGARHHTLDHVLGTVFLSLTGLSAGLTVVALADRPANSTVQVNPIGLAFAASTASLGTIFLSRSHGKKIYSNR